MNEATSTTERILRCGITRNQIGNLAWARLQNLMDDELGKNDPEPDLIPEAELCLTIMKAIANRCTRIVIELREDAKPGSRT